MTDLELSTYKASEDNALLPNGQNGAVHVDHTVEKSDHMNGQSSSNQDRDPEVSLIKFFLQNDRGVSEGPPPTYWQKLHPNFYAFFTYLMKFEIFSKIMHFHL